MSRTSGQPNKMMLELAPSTMLDLDRGVGLDAAANRMEQNMRSAVTTILYERGVLQEGDRVEVAFHPHDIAVEGQELPIEDLFEYHIYTAASIADQQTEPDLTGRVGDLIREHLGHDAGLADFLAALELGRQARVDYEGTKEQQRAALLAQVKAVLEKWGAWQDGYHLEIEESANKKGEPFLEYVVYDQADPESRTEVSRRPLQFLFDYNAKKEAREKKESARVCQRAQTLLTKHGLWQDNFEIQIIATAPRIRFEVVRYDLAGDDPDRVYLRMDWDDFQQVISQKRTSLRQRIGNLGLRDWIAEDTSFGQTVGAVWSKRDERRAQKAAMLDAREQQLAEATGFKARLKRAKLGFDRILYKLDRPLSYAGAITRSTIGVFAYDLAYNLTPLRFVGNGIGKLWTDVEFRSLTARKDGKWQLGIGEELTMRERAARLEARLMKDPLTGEGIRSGAISPDRIRTAFTEGVSWGLKMKLLPYLLSRTTPIKALNLNPGELWGMIRSSKLLSSSPGSIRQFAHMWQEAGSDSERAMLAATAAISAPAFLALEKLCPELGAGLAPGMGGINFAYMMDMMLMWGIGEAQRFGNELPYEASLLFKALESVETGVMAAFAAEAGLSIGERLQTYKDTGTFNPLTKIKSEDDLLKLYAEHPEYVSGESGGKLFRSVRLFEEELIDKLKPGHEQVVHPVMLRGDDGMPVAYQIVEGKLVKSDYFGNSAFWDGTSRSWQKQATSQNVAETDQTYTPLTSEKAKEDELNGDNAQLIAEVEDFIAQSARHDYAYFSDDLRYFAFRLDLVAGETPHDKVERLFSGSFDDAQEPYYPDASIVKNMTGDKIREVAGRDAVYERQFYEVFIKQLWQTASELGLERTDLEEQVKARFENFLLAQDTSHDGSYEGEGEWEQLITYLLYPYASDGYVGTVQPSDTLIKLCVERGIDYYAETRDFYANGQLLVDHGNIHSGEIITIGAPLADDLSAPRLTDIADFAIPESHDTSDELGGSSHPSPATTIVLGSPPYLPLVYKTDGHDGDEAASPEQDQTRSVQENGSAEEKKSSGDISLSAKKLDDVSYQKKDAETSTVGTRQTEDDDGSAIYDSPQDYPLAPEEKEDTTSIPLRVVQAGDTLSWLLEEQGVSLQHALELVASGTIQIMDTKTQEPLNDWDRLSEGQQLYIRDDEGVLRSELGLDREATEKEKVSRDYYDWLNQQLHDEHFGDTYLQDLVTMIKDTDVDGNTDRVFSSMLSPESLDSLDTWEPSLKVFPDVTAELTFTDPDSDKFIMLQFNLKNLQIYNVWSSDFAEKSGYVLRDYRDYVASHSSETDAEIEANKEIFEQPYGRSLTLHNLGVYNGPRDIETVIGNIMAESGGMMPYHVVFIPEEEENGVIISPPVAVLVRSFELEGEGVINPDEPAEVAKYGEKRPTYPGRFGVPDGIVSDQNNTQVVLAITHGETPSATTLAALEAFLQNWTGASTGYEGFDLSGRPVGHGEIDPSDCVSKTDPWFGKFLAQIDRTDSGLAAHDSNDVMLDDFVMPMPGDPTKVMIRFDYPDAWSEFSNRELAQKIVDSYRTGEIDRGQLFGALEYWERFFATFEQGTGRSLGLNPTVESVERLLEKVERDGNEATGVIQLDEYFSTLGATLPERTVDGITYFDMFVPVGGIMPPRDLVADLYGIADSKNMMLSEARPGIYLVGMVAQPHDDLTAEVIQQSYSTQDKILYKVKDASGETSFTYVPPDDASTIISMHVLGAPEQNYTREQYGPQQLLALNESITFQEAYLGQVYASPTPQGDLVGEVYVQPDTWEVFVRYMDDGTETFIPLHGYHIQSDKVAHMRGIDVQTVLDDRIVKTIENWSQEALERGGVFLQALDGKILQTDDRVIYEIYREGGDYWVDQAGKLVFSDSGKEYFFSYAKDAAVDEFVACRRDDIMQLSDYLLQSGFNVPTGAGGDPYSYRGFPLFERDGTLFIFGPEGVVALASTEKAPWYDIGEDRGAKAILGKIILPEVELDVAKAAQLAAAESPYEKSVVNRLNGTNELKDLGNGKVVDKQGDTYEIVADKEGFPEFVAQGSGAALYSRETSKGERYYTIDSSSGELVETETVSLGDFLRDNGLSLLTTKTASEVSKQEEYLKARGVVESDAPMIEKRSGLVVFIKDDSCYVMDADGLREIGKCTGLLNLGLIETSARSVSLLEQLPVVRDTEFMKSIGGDDDRVALEHKVTIAEWFKLPNDQKLKYGARWLANNGGDALLGLVGKLYGQLKDVKILDHPLESIRAVQGEDFVEMEQVSPYVLSLLLAKENERFYKMDSLVDFEGLMRVAKYGSEVGGSGIGQQLAKFLTLAPGYGEGERYERSVWRKLADVTRTLFLSQYTRNEILTMYLNAAYFGGEREGIRQASYYFFGKDPKDLNLAESALLVALPQRPYVYQADLDGWLKQARISLNLGVKNGVITQEQADQADRDMVAMITPTAREAVAFLNTLDMFEQVDIAALGDRLDDLQNSGIYKPGDATDGHIYDLMDQAGIRPRWNIQTAEQGFYRYLSAKDSDKDPQDLEWFLKQESGEKQQYISEAINYLNSTGYLQKFTLTADQTDALMNVYKPGSEADGNIFELLDRLGFVPEWGPRAVEIAYYSQLAWSDREGKRQPTDDYLAASRRIGILLDTHSLPFEAIVGSLVPVQEKLASGDMQSTLDEQGNPLFFNSKTGDVYSYVPGQGLRQKVGEFSFYDQDRDIAVSLKRYNGRMSEHLYALKHFAPRTVVTEGRIPDYQLFGAAEGSIYYLDPEKGLQYFGQEVTAWYEDGPRKFIVSDPEAGLDFAAQGHSLSCEFAVAASMFGSREIHEDDLIATTQQGERDPNVGFVGGVDGPWGQTDEHGYGIYPHAVHDSLAKLGFDSTVVETRDEKMFLEALEGILATGDSVEVWLAMPHAPEDKTTGEEIPLKLVQNVGSADNPRFECFAPFEHTVKVIDIFEDPETGRSYVYYMDPDSSRGNEQSTPAIIPLRDFVVMAGRFDRYMALAPNQHTLPVGFEQFDYNSDETQVAFAVERNLEGVTPEFLAEKTTFNLDLQQALTEIATRGGYPGDFSAIFMDPVTGEVLADANYDKGKPASEHLSATMRTWPGSTWKIATLAFLANKGFIEWDKKYAAGGRVYLDGYGKPIKNWTPNAPARMTPQEMIEQSNVGVVGLLRDYIEKTGDRDGFTQYMKSVLGDDILPGMDEIDTLMPDSKWAEMMGTYLTDGPRILQAFGQIVEVSPLHLLRLYSAIAADGAIVEPQYTPGKEPKIVGHMPNSPEDIQALQEALGWVASEPAGTAYRLLDGGKAIKGVKLYVKTGSAEVGKEDAKGSSITHSWFAGYAVDEKTGRKIAFVVFGEEAGEGSVFAGKIAKQVLPVYFDSLKAQRPGEFPTLPTGSFSSEVRDVAVELPETSTRSAAVMQHLIEQTVERLTGGDGAVSLTSGSRLNFSKIIDQSSLEQVPGAEEAIRDFTMPEPALITKTDMFETSSQTVTDWAQKTVMDVRESVGDKADPNSLIHTVIANPDTALDASETYGRSPWPPGSIIRVTFGPGVEEPITYEHLHAGEAVRIPPFGVIDSESAPLLVIQTPSGEINQVHQLGAGDSDFHKEIVLMPDGNLGAIHNSSKGKPITVKQLFTSREQAEEAESSSNRGLAVVEGLPVIERDGWYNENYPYNLEIHYYPDGRVDYTFDHSGQKKPPRLFVHTESGITERMIEPGRDDFNVTIIRRLDGNLELVDGTDAGIAIENEVIPSDQQRSYDIEKARFDAWQASSEQDRIAFIADIIGENLSLALDQAVEEFNTKVQAAEAGRGPMIIKDMAGTYSLRADLPADLKLDLHVEYDDASKQIKVWFSCDQYDLNITGAQNFGRDTEFIEPEAKGEVEGTVAGQTTSEPALSVDTRPEDAEKEEKPAKEDEKEGPLPREIVIDPNEQFDLEKLANRYPEINREPLNNYTPLQLAKTFERRAKSKYGVGDVNDIVDPSRPNARNDVIAMIVRIASCTTADQFIEITKDADYKYYSSK